MCYCLVGLGYTGVLSPVSSFFSPTTFLVFLWSPLFLGHHLFLLLSFECSSSLEPSGLNPCICLIWSVGWFRPYRLSRTRMLSVFLSSFPSVLSRASPCMRMQSALTSIGTDGERSGHFVAMMDGSCGLESFLPHDGCF